MAETSMTLTRTNVDVIDDNNKVIITTTDQGQIELTFPAYHSFHGETLRFKQQQRSSSLFAKAQQLNYQLTANDLWQDLQQAKTQSQSLFYSSDSDVLHLVINDGQNKAWEITLSHLQTLKHYAPQLPRWQSLLDVIDEMESLSMENIVAPIMEKRHEK